MAVIPVLNQPAVQTPRSIPAWVIVGASSFTLTAICEIAGYPIIQEIAAEVFVTATPPMFAYDMTKRAYHTIRNAPAFVAAANQTAELYDKYIVRPIRYVQNQYRAVQNGIQNYIETAIEITERITPIVTERRNIAIAAAAAGIYVCPSHPLEAAIGAGLLPYASVLLDNLSAFCLKNEMGDFRDTEAYNRIVENKESKSRELDLSGEIRPRFPLKALRYLSHLKSLNLSDNGLREIPHEFGSLTELRELNLSRNQLTELPSTMSDLKLIKLNLSQNPLVNFPIAVQRMTTLFELDIQNTQIARSTENCRKMSEFMQENNRVTIIADRTFRNFFDEEVRHLAAR